MMKKIVLYVWLAFISTVLYGVQQDLTCKSCIIDSNSIDAAKRAIDGDPSTSWRITNEREYFTLDLGKCYFLNKVQLMLETQDVYHFLIEASIDKVNWKPVIDKTNGLSGTTFGLGLDGIYRYVKFTALRTASGNPALIKEFKVFGTENGNNIARGKKFVNSKGQLYCEPERAVDGDISTYWCAENGGYPKSFVLDLERSCTLTGIKQVFKDYDRWKYTVEGSNNLQKWDMLDDKSVGVDMLESYASVAGKYRYIRFKVLGSASGFWANSCEFKVYGYENEADMDLNLFSSKYNESVQPKEEEWWRNTSGLIRYYCKLYRNRLSDITDSLDILKSRGFKIIELMCPYKGNADIWAGLGATDNYDIDPSIGTMADFENLIKEAHARDMKIIFFGNVGYCRDEAPFFQKACRDERDNVYSKERNWFQFSKTKLGNQWFWSELAQAYYFSSWGNTDGANGRIPSYNFNNQEWRDECVKYLRFWADKGIDGLFLDAPEVYLGITDQIIQDCIVDVLKGYKGLATNAEGAGDYNKWMGHYGFSCIQGFDLYGWGGGARSEVLNARRKNSTTNLDGLLKSFRDRVASLSGVTLTPPMWEIPASIDERIFETAYLTTMGTIFANHCGDKQYVGQDIISQWPEKDQERFHQLLRIQNGYEGLMPSGQRSLLKTQNDQYFSAFKRTNDDGHVASLVVFNFRAEPHTVSINLKNTGIHLNQTPIDLMTGTLAPAITSEAYKVEVPAYGYKILSVQNAENQSQSGNQLDANVPEQEIRVYPNPCGKDLNVYSPQKIDQADVYSLGGRLISELNEPGNSFTIPMQHANTGVYMVKLCDENSHVSVHKIIKY